jgi:hypothetical protein
MGKIHLNVIPRNSKNHDQSRTSGHKSRICCSDLGSGRKSLICCSTLQPGRTAAAKREERSRHHAAGGNPRALQGEVECEEIDSE